jgi:hypothetical protein
MVDCPEVVEYSDFKKRCGSSVCDPAVFDYILDELIRQGEVSEGTSENGERILKFKVENTEITMNISIFRTKLQKDQQSLRVLMPLFTNCEKQWLKLIRS